MVKIDTKIRGYGSPKKAKYSFLNDDGVHLLFGDIYTARKYAVKEMQSQIRSKSPQYIQIPIYTNPTGMKIVGIVRYEKVVGFPFMDKTFTWESDKHITYLIDAYGEIIQRVKTKRN